MRTLSLLLASLLLPACVVDGDWEDFTLSSAPFSNPYVDRGSARFEVLLAEGYVCPDGLDARVYVIEPELAPAADRPLAMLLHGRNFDTVLSDGEHLATGEDRLSAPWSERQVESTLGMQQALQGLGAGSGAWVAALLRAGFAVVAPADCWGDLWHGTGRNPYEEGFARYGTYLARDALRMAAARDGVDGTTAIVVGLGEGGRAVTELFHNGVPFAGAVVDSSPDDLSSLLAQPSSNADEIEALRAIYDDELRGIQDPLQVPPALQQALERDSLAYAVSNEGFRTPLVYAWSSIDERIDPAWAQPADLAITTNYPAGDALVLDWAVADHAPSNRSLEQAQDLLGFLTARLGLDAAP